MCHTEEIRSLSVCPDYESFISQDRKNINFWNSENNVDCYNLLSIGY